MKTITVAVIGCGRIAKARHFPALVNIKGVRIKYACDIILEKAESIVKEHESVETAIADYNIALADPEVDAVWVTTPNYVHYTVAMAALKAGKHVFCEKPITINYPLSLEMKNAADAAGKMLNIGVCNRYQESVERIRDWVEKGKFGKIYHVYCSFRDFRCIPGLGGDFTTKSQSGGGVLIDWGVHFLDLILYILGSPKVKTVTADAYCEMAKDMKAYKCNDMWARDTADIENGTNDVDDFITGHVRTESATISFNGAWAQNIDKREMYVDFLGDKGGARLDYVDMFTFYDGNTLETVKPEYELDDMYYNEDEAFINSVRTGIKDRNNIDGVIEVMRLMDAMYLSSDKKEEVKL